uniref:Uncharacterized protein n=1 Tax=Oryza sativa subsp. japonica TaxID=39947 RepID=Q75I05_ORYSJ|nr:hypothetical protein [Oryza sativa Japonica Group]AAS07288.1 hypothetical protein [Oryza sativa Japonica Group]
MGGSHWPGPASSRPTGHGKAAARACDRRRRQTAARTAGDGEKREGKEGEGRPHRRGGNGRRRKTREAAKTGDAEAEGEADVAGRRPDFAGDVGEEREKVGAIQNRIPPLSCASAAGRRGERGRRRGVGTGDAAWARGKRRSGCGGGGFGGVVTGAGGGRLGEDPTGGPHLSVTPGEEGGGAA